MSAALIAFLASGLLFLAGNAIWNGMMGLIFGVMATTPAQFSSGTWNYLVANLYPMTLGNRDVPDEPILPGGFFPPVQ